MSDIDVSAVCSETVYTGPISGPDESATLDSNVSNAGLIQGDEILAVDHTRLQNLTLSDWRSHWATQAANNQPVLLTIRRQGFEIDLPVSTDQRNSIESAFASTQAFRCELRDGRLEEVSVYRESENTLYYRQNDSAWTSITKPNSGTHFMVGIFDGTAGIQTVNTSFVETTAPLSQHFLEERNSTPEVPQQEKPVHGFFSWYLGIYHLWPSVSEIPRLDPTDGYGEFDELDDGGSIYLALIGGGLSAKTSETSELRLSLTTMALHNAVLPNIGMRIVERWSVSEHIDMGLFGRYHYVYGGQMEEEEQDLHFLGVGLDVKYGDGIFEIGYLHSIKTIENNFTYAGIMGSIGVELYRHHPRNH